MAGDGSLRDAVEALIQKEGVAGDVTLEGFVGAPRLLELYRGGGVYVSLSRSDSTSQSLLEAMASGLFPIATDIEGNREWITHRREGYLVPAGDADATACAIAEAWNDPEADAIRARARGVVLARGRFDETLARFEAKLCALAGAAGGR